MIGCAQEQAEHSHIEADHKHAELHSSAEVSSEHSGHSDTAHKQETKSVTTRSADSHSHGGAVLSVELAVTAFLM